MWLLHLAKAMEGEREQRIDSNTVKGWAGVLVLVSGTLGAVPPILCQGERQRTC